MKNLFNMELPRGNSTHAALLAVIGGYLVYLACQMVQNTLSGNSTMSMTTTWICAGVMALCGLAVVGYGVWMWTRASRAAKEQAQEEQANEE